MPKPQLMKRIEPHLPADEPAATPESAPTTA